MLKADQLLTKRQCYTYSLIQDPASYVVDSETAQVTMSDSYKYDEKNALKSVNIGKFGYGVNIKIGSDFTKLTPTNYDYRKDPYDVRWKHIDEFTGNVKASAVNTYNFKYYFYTDYYTYEAAKKF